MVVDTDRLVELCVGLREVSDAFGKLDPRVEEEMKRTIDREMSIKFDRETSIKFGRSIIYYASSYFAVAGLDEKDNISGTTIEMPPSIVGKDPIIGSIVYETSDRSSNGPVPSLIFETYETRISRNEIAQGAVQLFPFAALPLTELHYIEAIGFDTSNL